MDWQLIGQILWGICIVSWGAIRWGPNKRSRKNKINLTSRTMTERVSMVLSSAGLGYIPAIWIFTGFPESLDYQAHPVIILTGFAVFLVSLRFFRITHKALGKMWSHSLDLREGHSLVTTGIYDKVRHPMYSAFWLWAVAQPMLLSNWLAGFAGLIGFGTLFFLRVGQEEEMMKSEFGDEYLSYMKRTKRIIPKIY